MERGNYHNEKIEDFRRIESARDVLSDWIQDYPHEPTPGLVEEVRNELDSWLQYAPKELAPGIEDNL